MKRLCNKLNKIISEKKDGFIDELNKLMYEQVFQKGWQLYWDREIFIDCNGNEKTMKDLVRKSDLVKFEPSDDPTEHPGVVIRYKEQKQ